MTTPTDADRERVLFNIARRKAVSLPARVMRRSKFGKLFNAALADARAEGKKDTKKLIADYLEVLKIGRRLQAEVIRLRPALERVLPYMKTVSRSGNWAYEENDPELYEELTAALAQQPEPVKPGGIPDHVIDHNERYDFDARGDEGDFDARFEQPEPVPEDADASD